jgi:hypothetical protein
MKLISEFPQGDLDLDFLFGIPTVFAHFGFFAIPGNPKFYCCVTTLQGSDPSFAYYEVERNEIYNESTVLWKQFPLTFLYETAQGHKIVEGLTSTTDQFYRSLLETSGIVNS